jgi:hypothetical protein
MGVVVKAKLLVQAKLQDGETERVCWIDNAKVKKGSKVTLKNSENPKRRWLVLEVHSEIPADQIHSDWHAGGL